MGRQSLAKTHIEVQKEDRATVMKKMWSSGRKDTEAGKHKTKSFMYLIPETLVISPWRVAKCGVYVGL